MALLILAHCCLTVFFPVLSKLILGTDSEARWQISGQESCTNSLGLSVFEWGRGVAWSCKGHYLHTTWGIVCWG